MNQNIDDTISFLETIADKLPKAENRKQNGTADAPDGTSGEIQLSPEAQQAIASMERYLKMIDKAEAAGIEMFGPGAEK